MGSSKIQKCFYFRVISVNWNVVSDNIVACFVYVFLSFIQEKTKE
jgi:hypothetical protein